MKRRDACKSLVGIVFFLLSSEDYQHGIERYFIRDLEKKFRFIVVSRFVTTKPHRKMLRIQAKFSNLECMSFQTPQLRDGNNQTNTNAMDRL